MMDANISLGPGTGDLKMGRFGITLSDPTSSYFLCLSQDMIWTSLSSVMVFFVFNGLSWEVFHLDDIVDHHYLNFFFIIIILLTIKGNFENLI
jgi:hypothetical protein